MKAYYIQPQFYIRIVSCIGIYSEFHFLLVPDPLEVLPFIVNTEPAFTV